MAPRPENLALARLALTGVGAVAGASEAAVADLKLAVTEACTNAILHAYRDGAPRRARRPLPDRRRRRSRSRSKTTASGFDPRATHDAAGSGAEGQGMGLMIIRVAHGRRSRSRATSRQPDLVRRGSLDGLGARARASRLAADRSLDRLVGASGRSRRSGRAA